MKDTYIKFLNQKAVLASNDGFVVIDEEINPLLKPHQRDIVKWNVLGGRRADFCAFGLGKTIIQLETVRLVLKKVGKGKGLIVAPLGVRQEFKRDAGMLGITLSFVKKTEELGGDGIYLTNYESVRDGKIDVSQFVVISLDEASCLRGFGGTKTFREMMRLFEGTATYRFVATATPSPNEYIELLAYSAFLGIMDVSQAKTRFFKRDSTKADALTIHPHKIKEFWLWMASWAIFLQRPSDLGYSDEGYTLPDLDVRWHEVESDTTAAGVARDGQRLMFNDASLGIVEASREKRTSLSARIAKMMELRAEDPSAHRILWHDLEDERRAIEAAVPTAVSVYGSQDLDEREQAIIDFSDGKIQELAAKPVIAGSGCNFQRNCSWAIFLGIGFKFNDFIQAIHRIQRFLQTRRVRVDLIYTNAERAVRKQLERKWSQHKEMVGEMSKIIREYGLAQASLSKALTRALGVERVEASGESYRCINNDCVLETKQMQENSIGLILTSIPFSTQYEYSPNYADFGHTDDNEHFFRQMDFLTPNLLKVLTPGRIAAVHVKDRVVPGGMTGLGFQTVYPFHARCIEHYTKHGFAYMGMKTIVTDVVRENNQTYRLGWTEQCKDATKMGCGMPEYLLLFRKPPTSSEKSYADTPVVKSKAKYSRSRWQIDAHGFSRSSGNRLMLPDELAKLPHEAIFKIFREYGLKNVYDFEHHVKLGEALEERSLLPVTFMLLQPPSWHPDVMTDITRMLTLNGAQSAKGREMHLCLAKGSLVLTRAKGYIPIETVAAGDEVLTHKGRWKKVLIARCTGVQKVVKLKAHGVPELTLTPDHKVWARTTTHARERDGAEKATPQWVEAQNMSRGYVNMKLPPVEDFWGDTTLWWAVGRWLADGHFDSHGGALISVGRDKWAHFCKNIGRFGGNTPHEGTALQILLRDKNGDLRSILSRCGRNATGKHLPPEAFTLPDYKAHALLDGYLSGDGYLISDRNRWTASSASRELLMGIAFLVQRVHGAIATVCAGRDEREHVIEGRTVHAKKEWSLSFDLPGGRAKPFIMEDGSWKKVRSIDDANECETWCLKVEEDESFTAEGCIVKNCPMQFDLADRIISQFSMEGETVLDPFGGLMTVPYRAILLKRFGIGIELSPRYWLDGVKYCEAAEQEMSMPSLFDVA